MPMTKTTYGPFDHKDGYPDMCEARDQKGCDPDRPRMENCQRFIRETLINHYEPPLEWSRPPECNIWLRILRAVYHYWPDDMTYSAAKTAGLIRESFGERSQRVESSVFAVACLLRNGAEDQVPEHEVYRLDDACLLLESFADASAEGTDRHQWMDNMPSDHPRPQSAAVSDSEKAEQAIVGKMTWEKADAEAQRLGEQEPAFRAKTVREWAKAIGCSPPLVMKLPYWKDCARYREERQPTRGPTSRVLQLSDTMLAAIPDKKVESPPDTLADLIAQQQDDFEPNPLEDDPTDGEPYIVRSKPSL